ncbi:MAG: DEAD/DEAH box helicase family protein [Opitutaceae bacterium]|nr:DEAD/DEAH box helicase family protein [Opitutaceae bacterium]
MGAGARKIHSVAAGDTTAGSVERNRDNYRITDGDGLGEGSVKEKFRRNVLAIELLRALEAKRRTATPAEQSVLVQYVGWGGLPQVFASAREAPQWQSEQKQLKELLTSEEYITARATVLNAHYTLPLVVRAMYAGLDRLGFRHGRILEPACGLGHFFGAMSDGMRGRSELTGIEIDPLTARLAAMLYPGAEIRAQPFEEAVLPTNSFDLAISNVPFGDHAPFDPKINGRKFRIHDYYFLAAVERVRPGGLVAFITSHGTMDKQHSLLRELVAEQADLLAALRLPNTAFKQNANTRVTTDILFLRKRLPGEKPNGVAWVKSQPFNVGGPEPIALNEYYHSRVEMMLGRMQVAERGMYGRSEPELASDGRNLGDALAAAVASLPVGVYQPAAASASARQTVSVTPGVRPNAYAITEFGAIAQREGDELVLLEGVPAPTLRRLRGLIRIREAARDCLQAQVENRSAEAIDRARFRLNQDYDYFVGQFGPLSQSANVRAFAGDPDLPLLLSLENYDEDKNTATKTTIFSERTIQPPQPVEQAATAKEALVITLSEKGRVDLDQMARLLGKPEKEFLPELQGVLFRNPGESWRWETDDAYLSGNVREKLAAAEQAAKVNPIYRINVEALRSVQPVDLKATEIDARLGAVWIPASDIEAFVRDLLKLKDRDAGGVQVGHAPQLGLWTVNVGYYGKHSVANLTEWGTERVAAHELLADALNLRTPTVYDLDANKNPVINPTATEAAREKQQKIKDRFAEWVWQDDVRRERLVRKYNDEFNGCRLRSFNGDHLILPGASPAITLRPHQKAAVWRILQSPNTLLAHVVGAGKTYTMCAAAMELKRLQLARKPLFVVPNHMLGQFSSEMLTLYPNANILVAGKADFENSGRRELMSRIATSNWDAVIVTHSGFERLPISAKAREDFITDQIAELENCIRQQKADASDTRLVKELERAKKRLEFKLKTLSAEHRKDDTLTFEELGVDRLFVDEAQAFKNLFYVTKMTRVAGLPQSASERAFDMLLKVQHIQRLNSGGGVVFATGTPVTNTMAEIFTMQRYLQPGVLRRQSLQHFDSWAATFGETVTAMELAPDGAGFRLNTRFARFVNVPELMQLFRQFADVQTADMLKLPVPALAGGKPQIVRAPTTPALKAFVTSLAKRAERLKTGLVDPREDNMLKITGEGRKAALDLRLVAAGCDHGKSKVNQAVREIHSIWEKTRAERLTQLVFCDLSTPKFEGAGFSVYQDIRTKLELAGIPSHEIAFIQNHDSDAEKLGLFKDVRAGKVRILLGSTQKMGSGTNVQSKLVALHHLDAPWRPADIEQREGRILRQGNGNGTVRVLRYVTEGSFDGYSWQVLETKARFIAQVMRGESSARKIEDLDSPALTYAEVKAIASGNPLVIEKAKVDAEVMRLSRLRAEHAESQFGTRSRARMLEQDVPRFEKQLADMEQDVGRREDTHGDKFRMVVKGQKFIERAKAGEALVYLVGGQLHAHQPIIVGELAGFKVEFRPTLADTLTLQGAMSYPAKISASPVGIIASLEHAAQSIEERIAAKRSDLEQTRKNLAEITAHVGRPFEHEERYRELVARQAELVNELDLTKSQGSARLGAESSEPDPAPTEFAQENNLEAPAVAVQASVRLAV